MTPFFLSGREVLRNGDFTMIVVTSQNTISNATLAPALQLETLSVLGRCGILLGCFIRKSSGSTAGSTRNTSAKALGARSTTDSRMTSMSGVRLLLGWESERI